MHEDACATAWLQCRWFVGPVHPMLLWCIHAAHQRPLFAVDRPFPAWLTRLCSPPDLSGMFGGQSVGGLASVRHFGKGSTLAANYRSLSRSIILGKIMEFLALKNLILAELCGWNQRVPVIMEHCVYLTRYRYRYFCYRLSSQWLQQIRSPMRHRDVAWVGQII